MDVDCINHHYEYSNHMAGGEETTTCNSLAGQAAGQADIQCMERKTGRKWVAGREWVAGRADTDLAETVETRQAVAVVLVMALPVRNRIVRQVELPHQQQKSWQAGGGGAPLRRGHSLSERQLRQLHAE